MKLICLDCKKTFLYAAKQYLPKSFTVETAIPSLGTVKDGYLETHICPYCGSLNIEEFVEQSFQRSNLSKSEMKEA